MVTKRLKELFLAVAMLPLLVQPAFAHIISFHENNGKYDLWYSEPPDEKSGVYNPAEFQSVTAFDLARNVLPVSVIKDSAVSVVPQGDVAALIASLDHGLFVGSDIDAEHSPLKLISKDQAEAIGYANVVDEPKYTKALYNWSDALKQPLGLPLEIVPLENPFDVKGENLPIQVLFQGNVVKDADVEYLGETVPIDEQGIAQIPIGKNGLEQAIEVDYQDPTASKPGIIAATSLTANRTRRVPEPSALLGLVVFGFVAVGCKQARCFK